MTASQLSERKSSEDKILFPATKCIDGNTEGPGFETDDGDAVKINTINMCHTQNEPTLWIAIDYSVNVMVQRVEIFNRRGCSGQRTQNVEVVALNELQTSATSSDLSSSFRTCNLIKAPNSAFEIGLPFWPPARSRGGVDGP